jgi:NAD(P)-dependent dehydrogenase (short-subunit alcohol dehydrogenase family)
VVGLTRTFANWLAPHGIRVNCVNPSGVATRMVLNPAVEALFGGGSDPNPDPKPTEDVTNLLDVALVEPEDVTAAVAFLAADEAATSPGWRCPSTPGCSCGDAVGPGCARMRTRPGRGRTGSRRSQP